MWLSVLTLALIVALILINFKHYQTQLRQEGQFTHLKESLDKSSVALNELQQKITEQLHQGQIAGMKHLQESLHEGLTHTQRQVTDVLKEHTNQLNQKVETLTGQVDHRLKEISGQVEKRLSEGFEKTTATFTDIIKRLALIDEAQKKITELSSNIVSLQDILSDKHSRGAFGEVQLSALVRNLLPEASIAFQHTLGNGKRADCMLFLPEPTGNVVIDAKFPLEAFRKMMDTPNHSVERKSLEQQFRKDIRKHIQDIASKYIVKDETADGAVMFIPAEAIFAEIHAYYPDLVELAQREKVWLVSPTTMMAILTTARAVLKDADTRKQVHVIQEHLGHLAKDFARFQKRMDNLSRHLQQANDDAADVNTSARKISARFQKIEQVELQEKPEKIEVLSCEE